MFVLIIQPSFRLTFYQIYQRYCSCLLNSVHEGENMGFTLKYLHVERDKLGLLYRKALVPPLALPARLEAQQLIPQCFDLTSVNSNSHILFLPIVVFCSGFIDILMHSKSQFHLKNVSSMIIRGTNSDVNRIYCLICLWVHIFSSLSLGYHFTPFF